MDLDNRLQQEVECSHDCPTGSNCMIESCFWHGAAQAAGQSNRVIIIPDNANRAAVAAK